MLTYKSLNSLALQYLTEFIRKCSEGNCRNLRNSSETNLQIPLLSTSMGQSAFCYHGAKLRNEFRREAKLPPLLATHGEYCYSKWNQWGVAGFLNGTSNIRGEGLLDFVAKRWEWGCACATALYRGGAGSKKWQNWRCVTAIEPYCDI